MVAYLRESKIDLDKDYFCGILKAAGKVIIEGETVKYACGMCSMFYHADTPSGHLDEKIVRKHVKAISSRCGLKTSQQQKAKSVE